MKSVKHNEFGKSMVIVMVLAAVLALVGVVMWQVTKKSDTAKAPAANTSTATKDQTLDTSGVKTIEQSIEGKQTPSAGLAGSAAYQAKKP